MNILYVSGVCSEKKFKEIFELCYIKPQQQAQKFHNLLIKGFNQNDSIDSIKVMTALPLSRSNVKKNWFPSSKEVEGKLQFNYLAFLNFPILRHIFIFVLSFCHSFIWALKQGQKEKVVICDVLSLSNSVSALLVSKLCGVKSVAIVTDIPNYMQNYTFKKGKGIKKIILNLYRLLCNFSIYKYDSYILLTDQMNKVVNPKNKPFVIIEGMVDSEMKFSSNDVEDKYQEKVIIYAGALYEKYGVKKLIETFMKLEMNEARLWIFGSGELENDLKQYQTKESRIKYFGVVPNQIVIQEEIKSTLLVNPRPSFEEFTKYSFPSKNMEYMVSGTPVLTTPLPGMPKEYNDYVYIIDDETDEGIKVILNTILSKSKDELHAKGKLAKEFVLKEKNNVKQAKKVIQLLKEKVIINEH